MAVVWAGHVFLGSILMTGIFSPVFADDNGDLSIFDSEQSMSAYVEVTDVENGVYAFFDARGQELTADVREGRAHFRVDPEREPAPSTLEALLRSYFDRLPNALADFATKARATSSLDELIVLRLEIENNAKRSLMGKWLGGHRSS